MRPLLPLLVLAALAACQKPSPAGNAAANASGTAPSAAAAAATKLDRSRAGRPAPSTPFEDPDGEATTLAAFEGKPVLVNFWATWCAPCKKELPTLDALAAGDGDRLQVVSISEDGRDSREKVDAYLASAKFKKLDGWLDPKLAMTDSLKVNNLPTTILFDAKGREVWRYLGDRDWQSAESKALIAEAFR